MRCRTQHLRFVLYRPISAPFRRAKAGSMSDKLQYIALIGSLFLCESGLAVSWTTASIVFFLFIRASAVYTDLLGNI